MIHGIGHDVLEIKRLALLLSGQLGFRFMERVLTEKEREEARKRGGKLTEFVVEAVLPPKRRFPKLSAAASGVKSALATSKFCRIPWGSLWAVLSREAWERLNLPGEPEYAIHLTISHQTELASAFAVIEKRA